MVRRAIMAWLLVGGEPAEHATLDWLMRGLGDRFFGIVLLLPLRGVLPSVSVVAGILLFVPAYQMLCVHAGTVFPRVVTVPDAKRD